jgi:transcriptional repressor NrdR
LSGGLFCRRSRLPYTSLKVKIAEFYSFFVKKLKLRVEIRSRLWYNANIEKSEVSIMKCPYCGFVESKVIDSRSADDNERIRRRRECLKCGKRFTTHEIIETVPVIVVKRDKSRESFDRNKLTNGLLRACEKRPVSINQIEEIVNNIESKVYSGLDREITTQQIGELAMEQLKDIDEVSYVRFASVYRSFKDINTFMEELNKLLKEK